MSASPLGRVLAMVVCVPAPGAASRAQKL